MNFSQLTVITITFNNDTELISTLDSIEVQNIKPFVIVKDGYIRSRPAFLNHFSLDIRYISSIDSGIYHAMNQALDYVTTEFVTFLNSGDSYSDANSLSLFRDVLTVHRSRSYDIYFFPWTHYNVSTGRIYTPSLSPFRFNHQAVVYKTSLHATYGYYSILSNFTASDFLFFLTIF